MTNFNLLTKDILEIDDREKLQALCREGVKIFIEFVPNVRLHFGYYSIMLKIAELIQAGCSVIILISDLSIGDPMVADNRARLYEKIFGIMLRVLKVDMDMVEFKRGSSFQLGQDFTKDVYRLNSFRKITCTKIPVMEILMPSIQALNEKYLDVNARLGFDDDIEDFDFSKKYLPKIDYESKIHLVAAPLYNLKVDLLADRGDIAKTISNVKLMPLIINYLFPILTHLNKNFTVFRREEEGGPLHFDMVDKLEEAYDEEEIDTEHLMSAVVHTINIFVEPVRKELKTREWRNVVKHCAF